MEALKADPNLATETTVRRLAWDKQPENKEESREPSSVPKWLRWFFDLFGWILQTSQMLFWLLIAIFVAVLIVLLVRLFSARGVRSAARPASWRRLMCRISTFAPRVCRTTSAPRRASSGIAANTARRWRCCIADCCRGWRMCYEVPIRDSSTEGDCLMLAARILETRRTEYATRLVRTWQRAIYGGLSIDNGVVHELCAAFDTHLERPAGRRSAAPQ